MRSGGADAPPETGRGGFAGYSSSCEELQSTPSPPEPPKLGVMGVEGIVDGGAGAGLGKEGLGAATRRAMDFFLGAAFFLGATLRFATFFLRAGRRASFLAPVALRRGAFFLRAISFFLPRLADFFFFERFFAKPSPPFLTLPGYPEWKFRERTGL